MVLAVYPGTFDPMTLGHEDVLDRALSLFGRVIVAVAKSERKKPLFTLEERLDLARELVRGKPGVTVMGYEGLLCDFVHAQGARVIVRGVRAERIRGIRRVRPPARPPDPRRRFRCCSA